MCILYPIGGLPWSYPAGLKPNEEKVRAIMGAPRPIEVGQLRSFLGLMNYYRKLLSNLSSILGPLYLLLQRYAPWIWGKEQEDIFNRTKCLLVANNLLDNFDPEKALDVILRLKVWEQSFPTGCEMFRTDPFTMLLDHSSTRRKATPN